MKKWCSIIIEVEKNKLQNMKNSTTLGICDMVVEVEKTEIQDTKYPTEYLVLRFLQKSDTAGKTEITINCPKREEVLKLADNIREIAKTFSV
jgi:hypothetical protein